MNKSVVLYSTGCPSCNELKLLLNKANIEYIENNSIEEMLSLGFTKVPVLSVDGINMEFEEAKEWVKDNIEGGNR